MGQRSSVYLADNLAAAVKASGVPLGELVRPGLAAIPDGESSPASCTWGPAAGSATPPATASAAWSSAEPARLPLQGQVHKREIPPTAARAARRGAA